MKLFAKKLIATLTVVALTLSAHAQTDYTRADSLKVVNLLRQGAKQKRGTNLMIYFARQLRGVPYMAKTLEHNDRERLVVNLRQLDCTTYTETVLALTLCTQHRRLTFSDYANQLRQIRYYKGEVSYTNRLHYFSEWISSNTAKGLVREISGNTKPFTAVQKLRIDYMSTHASAYPMLMKHPEYTRQIAAHERSLCGVSVRYIPRNQILNTKLLRQTIHDGDILAIVTRKKGLDTSHIGIAVWHKDGLHLLNASQMHKKVVEEPMTLQQYMRRHPTQLGIRVIRPL